MGGEPKETYKKPEVNAPDKSKDSSMTIEQVAQMLAEERKQWEKEAEEKQQSILANNSKALNEQLRSQIEQAKNEALEKTKELEGFKDKFDKFAKLFGVEEVNEEELKKKADEQNLLKNALELSEKRSKEMMEELSKGFQAKLDAKDLEVYKSNLIASAKGEIIPELITGSTREEIDLAFKNSLDRYKQIKTNAIKAQDHAKLQDTVDPVESGKGVDTVLNNKDLNAMSDEELAQFKRDYFKRVGLR